MQAELSCCVRCTGLSLRLPVSPSPRLPVSSPRYFTLYWAVVGAGRAWLAWFGVGVGFLPFLPSPVRPSRTD